MRIFILKKGQNMVNDSIEVETKEAENALLYQLCKWTGNFLFIFKKMVPGATVGAVAHGTGWCTQDSFEQYQVMVLVVALSTAIFFS